MGGITLTELRQELARDGCDLTERAARDWWTKGLLPKPETRGLGRGKGKETYWPSAAVVDQAHAANDLLAGHGRAYTALVGLWLLGYLVPLTKVRAAWAELIERNVPPGRGTSQRPDDRVGEFAGRAAKWTVRKDVPREALYATSELLDAIMGAFYLAEDETAPSELADLCAASLPYWRENTEALQHLGEKEIGWFLDHFREWASVPSQRDVIVAARDAELETARRVLRLLLGLVHRQMRLLSQEQRDAMEAQGRKLQIVCGRLLLLPLVRALRDPITADFVSFVRDACRRTRSIEFWRAIRRQ